MPLPDVPWVRYAGLLSEADRLRALEAATIVVVPSPFESLSLLALEGMAVGNPVLCNAHADVLVDHCRRSNAGLFYSTREEFVECTHLLLADRDLRERMGRNGKTYVTANYAWNVIMAKYDKLIAALPNGMNTTLVRRMVFAAIFVTTFGIYVMRASNSGALREPPETGDGHDYDAIAFNVWQGRGFGYEWSDESWRKPYEGIPRYRLLLTRQSEYYPTTYRPPAMPYLLSAIYAVTGRNFTAWRVVNCGITAGAVTTAAIISAQFAGIPAAVITAAILWQSRELTRYSGMFMTEPLATLMLALLAWTWVRNASAGWTTRRAIASGVAMGWPARGAHDFHSHDTGPFDPARQGSLVRLENGVEDEGNLSRSRDRRDQPVVDSQHHRARHVHAAWYAGRHQPAHGLRPTRAAKPGRVGVKSRRWLARDRGAET